jgi:anaerobic ribonucleoside-triphosphate reductase activating protein
MIELTLGFLDSATGRLILDAELPAVDSIKDDLSDLLGTPLAMGCANPLNMITPEGMTERFPKFPTISVRISGFWHDSLVEGPGRRSVVRLQGCPIRCAGCWVPETWDESAGTLVPIDLLVTALLNPEYARDGITVLGGEPFAQPAALNCLIGELRGRQPDLHITVYSGYTLQALIARNHPDINAVLAAIDVLIDGPYVAAKSDGAGPWVGSTNQQVRFLR